jgi:curli biogenesis system outer membrane secretion channel CsgG
MNRGWGWVGLLLAATCLWAAPVAWADPPGKTAQKAATPKQESTGKLRPIRVAIFDVDVLPDVSVQSPAVTDQLNAILSTQPEVTLVNREQIKKVAEEHQIALSGPVETASAVKLGKFLSAQYIVTGRASQIGPTLYLVLKIVDVETTEFLLLKVGFVSLPYSGGLRFAARPSLACQGG